MDTGTKVFIAILFVLILVTLLFVYNQLYNNIDHRHVIVRIPRLVFIAPCPAPADLQLNPSILASLPELDYVAGSILSLECAVCITEFKAGEKIRLLPNCDHCFHIDCVDMWFRSHATCPLCRAHVENLDQELGAV